MFLFLLLSTDKLQARTPAPPAPPTHDERPPSYHNGTTNGDRDGDTRTGPKRRKKIVSSFGPGVFFLSFYFTNYLHADYRPPLP
jgi:hypothetical protein